MSGAEGSRLLAVQIANGYSSEASVLARVLGARAAGLEPVVLHHDWPGDTTSAGRFESEARTPAVRFDLGWRPDVSGRRSLVAKLASEARFRLALPKLLRTAERFNPDVIVSNQQKWDCRAATFLAQRLGKPQLLYLHFIVGPWLGGEVLHRLTTCAHVVAISDFIRGQTLQIGVRPDRVTTILNSIRVDEPPAGARERVRAELGVPLDAPTIGIVGRLDRYKGQKDSIEAFAAIAERFPTARLLIVGSTVTSAGATRDELESEAARTGFGDRIIFTGQRSDIPSILAALDVFIHPSRDEPFGLAMIEASAAGRPVVAYAEGAVPETVKHGETGLLAQPGDVPGLAASLTALVEDPERARRMGEAGKRWAALHFRPEDAARSFASLVSEIARTQTQRRSAWRAATAP